jgi:hypothetical protein
LIVHDTDQQALLTSAIPPVARADHHRTLAATKPSTNFSTMYCR